MRLLVAAVLCFGCIATNRVTLDETAALFDDQRWVVEMAFARQVAMYLLREETDSSLMDIGQMLGGRDHTTVIYGCEKIGEEINSDSRLRQEVVTIRDRLYQLAA